MAEMVRNGPKNRPKNLKIGQKGPKLSLEWPEMAKMVSNGPDIDQNNSKNSPK